MTPDTRAMPELKQPEPILHNNMLYMMAQTLASEAKETLNDPEISPVNQVWRNQGIDIGVSFAANHLFKQGLLSLIRTSPQPDVEALKLDLKMEHPTDGCKALNDAAGTIISWTIDHLAATGRLNGVAAENSSRGLNAKLEIHILLDALAEAAKGEQIDPEMCQTIESIANDWNAKSFGRDELQALYDCGSVAPEKVEGLDDAIYRVEAVFDMASDRAYETGIRTQVNGLNQLDVYRVVEAARRYARSEPCIPLSQLKATLEGMKKEVTIQEWEAQYDVRTARQDAHNAALDAAYVAAEKAVKS